MTDVGARIETHSASGDTNSETAVAYASATEAAIEGGEAATSAACSRRRPDRQTGPADRPTEYLRRRYLRACANDENMWGMTTAVDPGVTHQDGPELTTEVERQRYAAISRALADAKRLCVLELLSNGERSVSDLSREASCQVPNMSQHLAVLRSAGLVVSRRDGSTIYYRLTDPRILEAYRLIKSVAS